MPTDLEMKEETLAALPEDARAICLPELDKFVVTENLDGKPIIQKLYSQWKSGKKGTKNRANFWTCYHLGITSKKPDVSKPIFPKRRAFARPSPPDIDSDFDYFRRHEVMDYIVQRYGRYNVGNIGTYGALKMRSCLTRIIKTLDIANAFEDGPAAYTTKNVEKVDEILSRLPRQRGANIKVHDNEGEEVVVKTTRNVVEVKSKECDDFRYYMEKYPDIYRHANQLEGLLSIFSCVANDTPVLTQKGWVRIDQLDRSCKIAYLDTNGETQFTDKYLAWKTGIKKCYRLRLENGDFVDLTDDHQVLTDNGYVKFEEIRKNPEKYKVSSITL